mmetsp:Transcript_47039/g.118497  ORF Transcript_47039/g.118497 Transcript_47039/m.118497 type:complete len:544 (-) Transcript_47039:70-1701(-)
MQAFTHFLLVCGLLSALLSSSAAELTRLKVSVYGLARRRDPGLDIFESIGATTGQYTASGYIISDHEDIICGYDQKLSCRHDYEQFSQLVLTAYSHEGSRFAGWYVSGNNYLDCPHQNANPTPATAFKNPALAADKGWARPDLVLYTSNCRISLNEPVVSVRAYFVLDDTILLPVTEKYTKLVRYIVGSVSPVTPDNWVKQPSLDAVSDKDWVWAYGVPEMKITDLRTSLSVQFLGGDNPQTDKDHVFDDTVKVLLRDAIWTCSDDKSQVYDIAAESLRTGVLPTAKNKWEIKPPENLPRFGVCELNVTAWLTGTTSDFVRHTIVYRVLGTADENTLPSSETHIMPADYQVDKLFATLDATISSIPAGIFVPTGKVVRYRIKPTRAPPAGRYFMEVDLPIHGTTVGEDYTVCTLGFLKMNGGEIIFPTLVTHGTPSANEVLPPGTKPEDKTDRVTGWYNMWLPPGSVKINHLRRIIELDSNESPPDVVVLCKSLVKTKRNTENRSVSVGPVSIIYRKAATAAPLDAVVMNHRLSNIFTKTPSS